MNYNLQGIAFYLCTTFLSIRLLPERKHLMQSNAKAPYVGGVGERPVVDGLRGVPLDWPPPALTRLVVVTVGVNCSGQTKV